MFCPKDLLEKRYSSFFPLVLLLVAVPAFVAASEEEGESGGTVNILSIHPKFGRLQVFDYFLNEALSIPN